MLLFCVAETVAPLQAKFLPKKPKGSTARTGNRPKVTARELAYAKTLLETSDPQAAAKAAAGYGDAGPLKLYERANVRQLLDIALAEAGLTLRAIAKTHVANLKATKAVAINGKIQETPDYSTRQKAVSDGYQVHGAFDAKPQIQNYGQIVLYCTPETREFLESMRGSPLPPDCLVELKPGQSPPAPLPAQETKNGERTRGNAAAPTTRDRSPTPSGT